MTSSPFNLGSQKLVSESINKNYIKSNDHFKSKITVIFWKFLLNGRNFEFETVQIAISNLFSKKYSLHMDHLILTFRTVYKIIDIWIFCRYTLNLRLYRMIVIYRKTNEFYEVFYWYCTAKYIPAIEFKLITCEFNGGHKLGVVTSACQQLTI